MPERADALASFENKWIAQRREFGLALGFLSGTERTCESAFACLRFELEHAAFAIAESSVATSKLHWWLEEFARLGAGEPRHPLTQALANSASSAIPLNLWQRVIQVALQTRDGEPAAIFDELIVGYSRFQYTLTAIESLLFPRIDPAASTRVQSISRALLDIATLPEVLQSGRLPLPLDTLARHRLIRNDLAQPSPTRTAALRDHLQSLAREFDTLATQRPILTIVAAAQLSANRRRCGAILRSSDPAAHIEIQLARIPFATAWDIWRARRSRG
ncbi:MAG: hypothetical protein ABI451_06810 [Dokdonella sp.]